MRSAGKSIVTHLWRERAADPGCLRHSHDHKRDRWEFHLRGFVTTVRPEWQTVVGEPPGCS